MRINLLTKLIIDRIAPLDERKEETAFDPKRGEDIWIGRNVTKLFHDEHDKEIGTFNGQIVDVDDDEENVGHRIFRIVYEDGDDEWASAEEVAGILIDEDIGTAHAISLGAASATTASAINTSASAASAASATANTADSPVEPTAKQKKPSKYQNYKSAPINGVYFLYDVEVTGSKRNYDRIIQMSFISYDDTGRLLDNFSRLVNPGKVRITHWIKNNILPESKS